MTSGPLLDLLGEARRELETKLKGLSSDVPSGGELLLGRVISPKRSAAFRDHLRSRAAGGALGLKSGGNQAGTRLQSSLAPPLSRSENLDVSLTSLLTKGRQAVAPPAKGYSYKGKNMYLCMRELNSLTQVTTSLQVRQLLASLAWAKQWQTQSDIFSVYFASGGITHRKCKSKNKR